MTTPSMEAEVPIPTAPLTGPPLDPQPLPAERAPRRDPRSSLRHAALSHAVLFATLLVGSLTLLRLVPQLVPFGLPGLVVIAGILLVTVAAGAALVKGVLAIAGLPRPRRLLDVLLPVLAAGACAFLMAYGMRLAHDLFRGTAGGRGRQVRRRGLVVLPRLAAAPSWTRLRIDPNVPPGLRAGLAARWRENGRAEAASVSAFSRLTLHLMALGAPVELVTASHRDGLDEVRHAELCFALARRIDGAELGPGAFPQSRVSPPLPRLRTLALAALAVDSLLDGALHEGFSARLIAQVSKRCEDPAIAAMQREIAADEGRHAAHGLDIVRWCVAEGGRPVAAALLGALRVLPQRVEQTLPEGAVDGSWERWGIQGAALEAAEYAAARADVEGKVRALAAAAAQPRGIAA